MKRLLLILTLFLLITGCSTEFARSTSRLQVLLTDAPASEASSLLVTFSRIDLVPTEDTDDGLVSIMTEPRTLDVLQLRNGETELLADLSIPKGEYTQVRLIIQQADITFGEGEDAVTHSVKIPSGAQSGLKINIEPALVAHAGETSVLIVDFDASRAVIETPPGSNNYLLKPTGIRAVTASGVVQGTILLPDGVAPEELTSITISVFETYEPDTTTEPVTATIAEQDGTYRFITLLEGTYDLVIRAEGYNEHVIHDVQVTAGEATTVEAVTLEPVIE